MGQWNQKEREASAWWGGVAIWIKGIPGNACTQEATQMNDFHSAETVIYTIWETESGSSSLTCEAEDSGCSGLEVDGPALGQVQMEICLAEWQQLKCRWTLPLWNQLSPYGSSLGMQSGNTIWDTSHCPGILQSHIIDLCFFFTIPSKLWNIPFFFFCFPSPWFKWFSLS